MSACGRSSILILCILGLLVPQALATESTWTFQRIDALNPGASPQVSLAMRTGATWPTAFYEPSPAGSLVASSLTPVGWAKTTLDSVGPSGYVQSAAGADGRVGAAWQTSIYGNRIRFGQLTSLGWQYSTVASLPTTPSSNGSNAPDVAYLSGNRPLVAYAEPGTSKVKVAVYDGLGWDSEAVSFTGPGPLSGSYVTTAVDSRGDIGLAYLSGSSLIYAQKSTPGGTWNYVDLGNGFSSARNLSLAYGPNDQVGLAVLYGNGTVGYESYDIQSGQWQTETMLAAAVTSQRINLLFDAQGHPSFACVEMGSAVHYHTNNGDGWLDVTLPTGTDPISGLNLNPLSTSDAALAFDHAGLPVISYYGSPGGLLLAYDPQIAPEPASLVLAIGGLGILCRRRRRV